jgi:ATP-dependent Lon protease
MAETEFINIGGGSSSSGDTAMFRAGRRPWPDQLPILGLSDIVIFPGMVSPLLVESSPSIKLIDDVVGGNRLLGLVLQKDPKADNPKLEELHTHGCLARVLKMLKFPDNSVRVLVEGLRRFEITSAISLEPYLTARVGVLMDIKDDSAELTALNRNATKLFEDIIRLSPAISEEIKIAAVNIEDPGKAADLIAGNLNLTLEDRQQFLEEIDVAKRLRRLLPLLTKEQELLTLGSKIQSEVATSISKSQRDFYLREQIRAIQRELGDSDPNASEVQRLRERLDQRVLPVEARKVADQELDRLANMSPAIAEYAQTRNYLDLLASLPWDQSTEDKYDLDAAEKILNREHYGLLKVKDRLLEFLAVMQLKNNLKGPILCLVGPPGVGKTSLGQSVAHALGRKFIRISLGGLRDEAEIRGHRRTYVGALPGRIIQSLKRAESNNPVILLDEIDKLGSDFRGDPASALLEVLDPQQNNTFTDHYLDLPFDLSRVLFFTTANWLDPIQPALRDRLEVIELPSYTTSEKLAIAKRHLLPRQLEEHGLTARRVKISDATLRHLITDYTREAGVRQLEREIASVTRKAARDIVRRGNGGQPVVIKPERLAELLGPARFISEDAERIQDSGIAIGLAWTPAGGEILYIEATMMPGSGRLILTGSLGEVMKESAQTATSYLRSQARALKLELPEHDKWDVHIHVPAGATPKDGPSAGLTIAMALASLARKTPVRSDTAMTGEISLRGRVLRVGGIKEKVLAAARSGVKQLILPAGNRNDWQEVPEETRKKLKVHFVERISEALPLALKKA